MPGRRLRDGPSHRRAHGIVRADAGADDVPPAVPRPDDVVAGDVRSDDGRSDDGRSDDGRARDGPPADDVRADGGPADDDADALPRRRGVNYIIVI